jgi:hypothetical protein
MRQFEDVLRLEASQPFKNRLSNEVVQTNAVMHRKALH